VFPPGVPAGPGWCPQVPRSGTGGRDRLTVPAGSSCSDALQWSPDPPISSHSAAGPGCPRPGPPSETPPRGRPVPGLDPGSDPRGPTTTPRRPDPKRARRPHRKGRSSDAQSAFRTPRCRPWKGPFGQAPTPPARWVRGVSPESQRALTKPGTGGQLRRPSNRRWPGRETRFETVSADRPDRPDRGDGSRPKPLRRRLPGLW
jgi:hypothetical protein